MKIAIVRRECGLGLGGAEGYCENVARGLKGLGHDVTVVSRLSKIHDKEISWLRVPIFGRGSILKNMSYFFSAAKILKRHKFHLIYGLSRIANADFLRISDPLHAEWLERGYSSHPLPFNIRKHLPRHASLLWQEKKAISSAKFIITNSNLVRHQVVRHYRIHPDKIFTVYNGVDLTRFKPPSRHRKKELRKGLGLPEDATLLLFVGADVRRKGLIPLLKAVSALKSTSYNTHVAAAGFTPSSSIKRLIQELGIENRVHFLGFRTDTEKVYGAGDLLCLPTSYDPFANVCLEAMACGLPVLTTKWNGASELVEQVASYLVIKSPEAASIHAALEKWFNLQDFEKEKLSTDFATLAQGFGLDDHVYRLHNVFEKALLPGV